MTLNHNTLKCWWAGSDWPDHYKSAPGFQLSSSLLLQIQQEARAAFSPLSCEQLVFCSFHLGQEVTTIAILTWLGNLYPISTGKSHTCHPLSLQPWTKDWNCKAFLWWASSQPSSHGTVSSTRIIFRSLVDHSTVSGRRVVCTTSGSCSLIPASTTISQELAACSRLGFALLVEKGLGPLLDEGDCRLRGCVFMFILLDMDITNTLTLLQIRCFPLVLLAHMLIFNTSP